VFIFDDDFAVYIYFLKPTVYFERYMRMVDITFFI